MIAHRRPKPNLNSADIGGKNSELETIYGTPSEAIKALVKRITALERILDPLGYEDPRKLFGGSD